MPDLMAIFKEAAASIDRKCPRCGERYEFSIALDGDGSGGCILIRCVLCELWNSVMFGGPTLSAGALTEYPEWIAQLSDPRWYIPQALGMLCNSFDEQEETPCPTR
jgi:hypothetical protein